MGVLLQTMAGKAIMNKMADIYWGSVSKQLNRFGLRYEDILVETPEVREALRRLSPEAKEGRSQRYRRAIDLSFKKHYLPETIQAKLDVSNLARLRVGFERDRITSNHESNAPTPQKLRERARHIVLPAR